MTANFLTGCAGDTLSAAHPQPNAQGVKTALVAGIPLCRGALKGATSSPWAEMRVGSADEQLESKSLEPHADLRFQRRLSNPPLQRPHCCDRTARWQTSRYWQTGQTRSLKIFANMIGFSIWVFSAAQPER